MFCPQCGKKAGNEGNFCMYCGYNLSAIRGTGNNPASTYKPAPSPAKSSEKTSKSKSREDVLMGCVGAVLGAVLAGIAYVLLAEIGYFSSAVCAAIPIFAILGYELLGGDTSNVTIVATLLLCLIMPYLAERIAWTLAVKEAITDVNLWEAFKLVPEAAGSAFWKDLIVVYVFTALGGISAKKMIL